MPLTQFKQQRFAMHGVGQKCFQQNVFRLTEVGHECLRDDYTVCSSSIHVSEHSVVFDTACDARACAVLYMGKSLMM